MTLLAYLVAIVAGCFLFGHWLGRATARWEAEAAVKRAEAGACVRLHRRVGRRR